MRRHAHATVLIALAAAACGEVEPVVEDLISPPATPREGYARTLEAAGLDGTALMRDWTASAEAALVAPPAVPPLFRETIAMDPSGRANAWRVPVRRGQRIRVAVEAGPDDTPIFLDAFELYDGDDREAIAVAHAEAGHRELSVEPNRDGEIVVRAQPGLLTRGRYTVAIRVEPTLGFPVAERGLPDVGSVFGDPRDGGARDHHGIDIFAPRGTPVVAATKGTVSRVQTTPRGGKVVWLRDARRRQSLYYAHLDSQLVSDGMRVQPGDTLGLVGNTGNARTTPPHLHFGIYSRGPVDPVPFVRPLRGDLPELSVDTARVGQWIRTVAAETPVLASPGNGATLARLPRNTAMRVLAANASWLRVQLPDGTGGYVTARTGEAADQPFDRTIVAQPSVVRASPGPAGTVVATLASGASIAVHGRFGEYVLIRTEGGARGWIEGGG